jgi:capsular polysaccharide biosynthesis protein
MNTPLSKYGGLLLARWRWVVWGILLALLTATVVLLVKPPVYRSEATVFVRTPGDVSRVLDGGDFFARARADTYAALAKGSGVSARVVADLGLKLTPEEFSRRVDAESRPNTALLDLSVTAPSAIEARRGLTVVISELQSTVRTLEAVPGSVVPRAELVVVDPPGAAHRVVAWGLPIAGFLLGAVVLGAVLGALGAVLRTVFSSSISDDGIEAVDPTVPRLAFGAGALAADAGDDVETAVKVEDEIETAADAETGVEAAGGADASVVAAADGVKLGTARHRRSHRALQAQSARPSDMGKDLPSEYRRGADGEI